MAGAAHRLNCGYLSRRRLLGHKTINDIARLQRN